MDRVRAAAMSVGARILQRKSSSDVPSPGTGTILKCVPQHSAKSHLTRLVAYATRCPREIALELVLR